jgi:hypothetical protein
MAGKQQRFHVAHQTDLPAPEYVQVGLAEHEVLEKMPPADRDAANKVLGALIAMSRHRRPFAKEDTADVVRDTVQERVRYTVLLHGQEDGEQHPSYEIVVSYPLTLAGMLEDLTMVFGMEPYYLDTRHFTLPVYDPKHKTMVVRVRLWARDHGPVVQESVMLHFMRAPKHYYLPTPYVPAGGLQQRREVGSASNSPLIASAAGSRAAKRARLDTGAGGLEVIAEDM